MKRLLAAALLLLWPALALAQNVTVIGPVTAGNCAAFNSNTVIKDAGAVCGGGGGGTPAAPNNSVQFNNSGAFGGSSGLTYNPATSTLSGIASLFNPTNANVNSNGNDLAGSRFNITYDINSLGISIPGFTNEDGVEIVQSSLVGQNVYAGGTNAKKTFAPINVTHNSPAAGQRFAEILVGNYYGMGDAFVWSVQNNYQSGPGGGDEGQGFAAVSYLKQPDNIITFTILSLPTKSGANTTTTQPITGSQNIQTVTVASTTGISVNDWVVVEQSTAQVATNIEAVQITAVGSGNVSGRFINNHTSGVSITPALLITPSGTFSLGEQRLMVDTTSSVSYSTGQVTAISGANFTGTGTAWTASIVGGTASNVGAIALASDDQTTTPFNTTTNRLKSWYPILSVASNTSLNIHSFSVAGDASYKGKGVSGGPTNYIIRPAARILMVVGGLIVAETSNHVWTVGDTVEEAICTWPDVTGFQFNFGAYTPGGTYRYFMNAQNTGFQKFGGGYLMNGGVGNAFQAGGGQDYAFDSENSNLAAIRIVDGSNLNGGKILWASTGQTITSTYNFGSNVGGLTMNGPGAGGPGITNGALFLEASVSPNVNDGAARLHWPGTVSLGRIISEANDSWTVSEPVADLVQTWNGAAIATTGASGTGSTATITFAAQAQAFPVGSIVTVAGVTPAGYNGSFAVTGSTTTSVSYNSATTGAQTVAGTVQQQFTGFRVNASDLASAPGSLIEELQVNGTDVFTVDKLGYVNSGGESRVTADFPVTSSTTLVNVTGLSVTVRAGRTYKFNAEIPWTDAAAGGIKAAIAGTATATNVIYDGWIVDSAANGIKGNAQATALGGTVASSTTTGTAGHLTIQGTITVANAGTLTVQIAQNTSSGTATTAKQGATFMVQDIP